MAPFEDVAATFWDSRKRYGVLPALTGALVGEAEGVLGVKLPVELLALLRQQNGGVVSSAWHRYPSEPNFYADDQVPFEVLFGIEPGGPGWQGDHASRYAVSGRGVGASWPRCAALREGHYWVALDYRSSGSNGEPSVVWIDNEMEQELQLAPTFRRFIEGPDWRPGLKHRDPRS